MDKKIMFAIAGFLLMIPVANAQGNPNDPNVDNCKALTLGNGDIQLTCPPNTLPFGVGEFGQERIQMNVLATDYAIFDTAHIIASVFESEASNTINDAFCDYQIFFPNRTLFDTGVMDFIPLSRGLYSDNTIIIPNVTGVYPVNVICTRPVNESNQPHFLFSNSDFGYRNQSGTVPATLELQNVDVAEECSTSRFIHRSDGFGTEFNLTRFVANISDIRLFVEKDGGADKTFEIIMKFRKVTNEGDVLIGTASNTTLISTVTQEITFSDVVIDFPWTFDSRLETELCAKNIDDSQVRDILFSYNSSALDSGFTLNGKAVSSDTDFEVSGGSELNVKLIGGGQTQNLNASITGQFDDILDSLNAHNQSNADEFTLLSSFLTTQFSLVQTTIWDHGDSLDQAIDGNSTAIITEINEVDSEVWSFLPDRTLTEVMLENVTFSGNISMSDQNLEDIARKVYEFFFLADALPEQRNIGFFEQILGRVEE